MPDRFKHYHIAIRRNEQNIPLLHLRIDLESNDPSVHVHLRGKGIELTYHCSGETHLRDDHAPINWMDEARRAIRHDPKHGKYRGGFGRSTFWKPIKEIQDARPVGSFRFKDWRETILSQCYPPPKTKAQVFVIDEADIPDKDFEIHVLLVGPGNEETLDTWLNGERYAIFWIQGFPLVAIIVTSPPRPKLSLLESSQSPIHTARADRAAKELREA